MTEQFIASALLSASDKEGNHLLSKQKPESRKTLPVNLRDALLIKATGVTTLDQSGSVSN